MKKIIALVMIVCTISVTAFAQTTKESKDKVKKTSNLGQKVHNVFSKHKHYNGYKVKHTKDVNGHEVKEKKVVKTDN